VIKDLVAVAGGEASGGIKKEMQSGVGGASSMCRRSIPGKYPFSRGSAIDVGVQDFVGVFRSGGDLDAFFTTNLSSLVDRSGAVWRLKATGEGAPPVSAATLRQFQNAEAIRIAFLGGGGSAQVVADVVGEQKWMKMYDALETTMVREKKIYPNLDFPAGPAYYMMGFEIDFFTPIFVMARTTGWSAHIMEQANNNRIIRPLSEYTGPGERSMQNSR
jgi:hypothetical protein